MGKEMNHIGAIHLLIISILLIDTKVMCDDTVPIPKDKGAVEGWFKANLKSNSLNPVLQDAEKQPTTIKVRADGSGDFKTIKEAIASIPAGNKNRVNIDIGKGVYTEKIQIDRTRPFITLLGQTGATIQYGDTAKKLGTFPSASVTIESDYFMAYNIIFKNTAPKPDATLVAGTGGQAVALRIAGDMAAFYKCKFYGFQDTLCDEKGRHLFKDCFIQGTVDFIFGSGKSLYLNCELNVLKDKWKTVITAQAKQELNEDSGFSFVHCRISGDGINDAYLGRAWMAMPEVVYAYTTMGKNIFANGWDPKQHPVTNMFFGEFENTGPGADTSKRVKFAKILDPAQAKRFLNLGYIVGSKWLLPPPA